MAISVENILNVRRKAFNYLSNGSNAGAQVSDPVVFRQMRELFSYLSDHGNNPDLQFVPFADLTGDTVIADAACKVYAIYAKKRNTATDAFFKAVDHASTAAGTTFFLCSELNVGRDVFLALYPKGLAQANGVTLVSSTTDTGNTDTTSGDGPDGFVIIGNP